MSDPLKERAALEQHIQAAWDQYSRSTAERQATERELNEALRQLDSLRKLRATSRATDKEIRLAEQRVDKLQAAHQQQLNRANEALDTAKNLEPELEVLLRKYADVYAEQAEQVTAQAKRQLEALGNVLDVARDAWDAAARAWAPLAQAHGLQGVEPCPLPDPDDLRTLIPRPGQVALIR